MGLDQTIKATKEGESHELKYWRNNHALHRFMSDLYKSRPGNTDADCSCLEFELTAGDIEKFAAVSITDDRLAWEMSAAEDGCKIVYSAG